MTNWCILRTAPSRTLLLCGALQAAGFRAWTPQETRVVRHTRSRDRKEVPAPMTPTIVFAEYERLPELVSISRQPPIRSMGLPSFTVFRYLDVYPRIADNQLNALRLAEQRGRPRAQARVFRRSELVQLADCGFEGLVGTVEGTQGRFTLVSFPGFQVPVKIAAQNLLPYVQAA